MLMNQLVPVVIVFSVIQRFSGLYNVFCFRAPSRSHSTPDLNAANLLTESACRQLTLSVLLFGAVKTDTSGLYHKLAWSENRFNKVRAIFSAYHTPAFRGSVRFASFKHWNEVSRSVPTDFKAL